MDLNYLYARAKIASDNLKNKDKNKEKEPIKPMKDIAKKWYLTILVFLIAFGMTVHTNTTYDGWWHYKLGEYIVNNKEVPNTAVFSWWGLEQGTTWISHEWLFSIVIYGISKIFGFNTVPIFAALVTSLLIALIVYLNFENIKNSPLKSILLTIWASMLLIETAVGRPQIFLNWLLFGAFILIEHEFKRPDNKIFLLIPLMTLWVNIHGGSWILLPFFFGLAILCNSFDLNIGRIQTEKCGKKVLIKRIIVLVLTIAVVWINPHGVSMYVYPFSNATDTTMLTYISEWSQLKFNNVTHLLFLVLPVIYFIYAFATKEKINIYEFIVELAFVVMTLKAVRFSTQLTIISFYLITKNVPFKQEKHFEQVYKVLIQILIIYLAYTGGLNIRNVYNNPYKLDIMPSDEIIETIKESNTTRLYNPYNVGGYLIYNGIETFVDGRADIYSRDNFEDYASITVCEYGFEEKMEKYNFEAYLVEKDENLYDCLLNKDDVVLKAEDDNFAYFVKRENLSVGVDKTEICNSKGC